jgi:HPt (histidine-containing phosphotransfer) domain-containing protein
MQSPDRIRVEVDPDLEDLVPSFLENRRADITTIRNALEESDYRRIHRIGHNMKGDSGALGFVGLSDVGRGLEQAALQEDEAAIQAQLVHFSDYLERVEVVQEPCPEQ